MKVYRSRYIIIFFLMHPNGSFFMFIVNCISLGSMVLLVLMIYLLNAFMSSIKKTEGLL